MKSLFYKKIIGTIFVLVTLGGLILPTFSFVQARFLNTSSSLRLDGVVASVGPSSLTVNTPGASNITVNINYRTIFSTGLALSDFAPGDRVFIMARTLGAGNPLALIIKKLSGTGYGTSGDQVTVTRAYVIAKTANTFTVDTGAAHLTFKVLASTKFLGSNFSSLGIGNLVNVFAEDSGTEFVARTVVVKR